MTLLNYFKPQNKGQGSSPHTAATSTVLPRTFVSWNCNGLVTRMQSNRDWVSFSEWVTTQSPDIICLQEVKLSAACNSRDCVKGDGKPRDRGMLRDNTKSCREDFNLVNLKLNQKPFSNYQRIWSLSDWKYSGVLCLIKKPIKVLKSRFNLLPKSPASEHHYEGRIIQLEFENIHFLGTYAPNHGWEVPHWNRRDQWDQECANYFEDLRKKWADEVVVLPRPSPSERESFRKPFLWMGDLNVATTDMDLSHPKWFRQQVNRINNKPVTDCPSERVGQPGCAQAERDGFKRYCDKGQLVDAYRILHPQGPPVATRDTETNEILVYEVDNHHFSWRGTPGINDPTIGRFYAKGMRIDHALITEEDIDEVESVEIIGSGAERKQFWGSDHSAVIVTLKDPDEQPAKRRRLESTDLQEEKNSERP